jgi:hypothetical protein
MSTRTSAGTSSAFPSESRPIQPEFYDITLLAGIRANL